MISDRLIAAAGLCTPASSASESSYTLVEAVDEGWFYSALLPSREYLVAYMTDADLYSKGRSRSSRFLESQLEKAPHTRERIGLAPSERWLVPAFSSVREHAADRHWLAVGDAARSYDPLSGLGVCASMNMAIQAVPPILRFLRGDSSGVAEYDRVNRKAYAEYEETRRTQYSLEHRWPESDFWQRRRNQA
jgi:flavin-dependent dehydrogenase